MGKGQGETFRPSTTIASIPRSVRGQLNSRKIFCFDCKIIVININHNPENKWCCLYVWQDVCMYVSFFFLPVNLGDTIKPRALKCWYRIPRVAV